MKARAKVRKTRRKTTKISRRHEGKGRQEEKEDKKYEWTVKG